MGLTVDGEVIPDEAVEFELKRQNLNYVKFGGRRVSEGAHVRDFLAFLKNLTM